MYWQTGGIASIGLRPHSAYGPGRDQGVTSKPTLAMIAAAGGRPYHVDFGGSYQFQFVEDVAAAFIAAARADRPGADVFSIGGPRIGVDEIVEVIAGLEPSSRGRITFGERILPFPAAFDGSAARGGPGCAAGDPGRRRRRAGRSRRTVRRSATAGSTTPTWTGCWPRLPRRGLLARRRGAAEEPRRSGGRGAADVRLAPEPAWPRLWARL